MAESINTDLWSLRYRERILDLKEKRLLVTNFEGTEQEKDLSEPPNCGGVGRIRHFKRETSRGWPPNPLPIDPACSALGLPEESSFRAQVFQNAACNWRCWYCFVPFDLLSANPKHSVWLSPKELIDRYLQEKEPPQIIDLTGGQPDLVPEWLPWTMSELKARGLEKKVYLWSDDNLSTDYLWRFLSDAQIEMVTSYPCYGRAACFKGFNAESFSFNTSAEPALFVRQFELMERLFKLGIDLYAYATFTTPTEKDISDDMRRFIDRMQTIHEDLPLRTVPLEIRNFSPVVNRIDLTRQHAIELQYRAIEAWQREISLRFDSAKRLLKIYEVIPHRNRLSQ